VLFRSTAFSGQLPNVREYSAEVLEGDVSTIKLDAGKSILERFLNSIDPVKGLSV